MAMEATLKTEVDAAFDAADAAPLPTPEMVGEHVYA